MSRHRNVTLVARTLAAAVLMAGSSAAALPYEVVATWAEINQGGPATQLYSAVAEGQTLYAQTALNNGNRIMKTTNLNGAQSTTELMSQAAWTSASGQTNLTSFYGFSISGDFLQFSDTGSDAIWRVHKNTGEITNYVSRAQIGAVVGDTTPNLLSPGETAPNGEFTVYEGDTDNILITAGAGNVSKFVSTADLTSVAGNSDVSGGLGFDLSGALYWGSNTSDSLYKRAADGTLSQVLSAAQIESVTGAASVGFKDIFGAPDGRVYFNDNTSKHILRFDPADPAGTLEVYVTGQELLAGPAATDNIFQLTWYDGRLAFNVSVATGARGYYAVVPEPASAMLLGLGLLAVRRRSRRA